MQVEPMQVTQIDPGFFALFVKTSPAHAPVAALLKHDFHDADRILKTMAAELTEIYLPPNPYQKT